MASITPASKCNRTTAMFAKALLMGQRLLSGDKEQHRRYWHKDRNYIMGRAGGKKKALKDRFIFVHEERCF